MENNKPPRTYCAEHISEHGGSIRLITEGEYCPDCDNDFRPVCYVCFEKVNDADCLAVMSHNYRTRYWENGRTTTTKVRNTRYIHKACEGGK